MRYEKRLAAIASDDVETARLIAECSDLRAQLEALTVQTGNTALFEELVELIIRVTDHLFASQESLRKRVRGAMGGEVLELWRERATRMEQEARKQGYDDGVEQGIEQGIEQGANDLAKRLQERGIDKSLLDEVLASMRTQSETSNTAPA